MDRTNGQRREGHPRPALFAHIFLQIWIFEKKKKLVLSFTDLVSATKDLFTLLIIKVLLLDVSFIWCPNYSLSHDRDRTEKLTH